MTNHDGVGNKKKVVDVTSTTTNKSSDLKNTNFDLGTTDGTSNFIEGVSSFVDSPDTLRSRTGYCYTSVGNEYIKIVNKNGETSLPLTVTMRDTNRTESQSGVLTMNNINVSGDNILKVKDYLSRDLVGKVFLDHYHDITIPAVESDSNEDNNVPKKMFLKSRISYNYHHDKYEKFLNTSNINENSLPNLYNFISENITGQPVEQVRFQNTLGGRLDISKNPLVKTPKAKKFSDLNNVPLKEYLRNYATIYDQTPDEVLEKINQKSRNVVIPLTKTREFQSQNSKKDFFPAYVELEFAKGKRSEFVEVLKTSKKEDEFVTNLIHLMETNQSSLVDFSECLSQLDGFTSAELSQKRVWDIPTQLIESTEDTQQTVQSTTTFLGNDDVENNLNTSPRNSIFNSLVDVAFQTKYDNFIKDKVRRVDEFLYSKEIIPAYSEVVLYRISKYSKEVSNTPMKNYYVLNTSDNDVINFYDTQVKINNKYIYTIHAYTMVIGNEYRYRNIRQVNDGILFTVRNSPSVKLIEHQIGLVDNCVLSDPPMMPDITPYTFFDVDNKVGFNFNSSVGKRLMNPISFTDEESLRALKLKKAQNRLLNPDGKIMFSGDSPNRFYEVYRVEEPPTSEQSFLGNMRTRTSKTSFVDTVEPNRKYYYLFRAIDNHGNVSNPSSVIQVQIVKDRTIFTEIRNYTYDSEKNIKNKAKTFKKYFRIIPSSPNLLLDLVKSGIQKENGEMVEGEGETGLLTAKDITTPALGVGQHTIWGKKFKLRITSKSSGKKMDVNFRMKQKYTKPNEELT
jgi:hypothetical protein